VIIQPYTTLQYHSTRQKVSDYSKSSSGLISSRIINKNDACNMPWCRQGFYGWFWRKGSKNLAVGNVFIDTVEEIRPDDGLK